jgi:Na+/H+ antiporter NhaC
VPSGAWSLVPFLVVIPIAVVTRQVIPGLVAGLLVGGLLVERSLLGGLNAAIAYLLKELAVPDNLRLVLFLYAFGALVGLLRASGGVSGFGQWVKRFVRTRAAAFNLVWLSALGTFMAPDFRIITVGPVMQDVMARLNVAKEEIGYAIDVTATPFSVLVPVGTVFVGYMVGLLATVARHHHVGQNPYQIYLLSIPLNFFALVMLAVGAGTVIWRSRRAKGGKAAPGGGSRGDSGDPVPDPVEYLGRQARPDVWNLAVPLGLLLLLTGFFTWLDSPGGMGPLARLLHANASLAMLQALMVTLLVSLVLYLVRGLRLNRLMQAVTGGGNEMVPVIVLLALVWAVSAVATDLGLTGYLHAVAGHRLPPALVAPILFVAGSLLSYFIGSSFGTWGILLPIGFSLAGPAHVSPALIAASVFASGTFGGFASPLSDNTVAMAAVLRMPVVDYARYKLKSALVAALIATVLFGAGGYLLPA